MKHIDYSILPLNRAESKIANLEGEIADSSDCGIGIRTHHRLHPGDIFRLSDDTGQALGGGYASGIIRWSMMVDDKTCRAGVEWL